jgi:hypothetical protein
VQGKGITSPPAAATGGDGRDHGFGVTPVAM